MDVNPPPSLPPPTPPTPPTPPGSLTYPYSLNFQSSTSVAIIIVVLGATFFFMFLFVIYIKRCNVERMDNDSLAAATGGWNRQQQMIHGLDPEILKKFPIIKFSSLVNTRTRPKDALECAVCLAVFEDSELLRLLPACAHLFHPDCIDMWLHTHSTCPLCRRSLSRDAVSGHLQRALAALTGSIRNSTSNSASPEGSAHADNPDVEAGTELPSNNTTNTTNTGQILRALSRNSESFKLAAHNLEVQDVRDRIRAAGSSSSGRFASPNLNSSSSGRFHRVSSRSPIDPGVTLTPLPCGVMQHSQSFSELSTQAQASPNSRLLHHPGEGEVQSERLRSIPRTMSFSSLRRSFSTSSSSSNKPLQQQ